MDPRANLTEQLALAREILDAEHTPPWATEEFDYDSDKWGDEQDRSEWYQELADKLGGQANRLAELALALDEWRRNGGFAPEQPEVYILSIETKYGTDHTAHRTEAGAMAEAAAFVRRFWSNRHDLEGDAPADDSEAVAAYFDDAADDFYSITCAPLED